MEIVPTTIIAPKEEEDQSKKPEEFDVMIALRQSITITEQKMPQTEARCLEWTAETQPTRYLFVGKSELNIVLLIVQPNCGISYC